MHSVRSGATVDVQRKSLLKFPRSCREDTGSSVKHKKLADCSFGRLNTKQTVPDTTLGNHHTPFLKFDTER